MPLLFPPCSAVAAGTAGDCGAHEVRTYALQPEELPAAAVRRAHAAVRRCWDGDVPPWHLIAGGFECLARRRCGVAIILDWVDVFIFLLWTMGAGPSTV